MGGQANQNLRSVPAILARVFLLLCAIAAIGYCIYLLGRFVYSYGVAIAGWTYIGLAVVAFVLSSVAAIANLFLSGVKNFGINFITILRLRTRSKPEMLKAIGQLFLLALSTAGVWPVELLIYIRNKRLVGRFADQSQMLQVSGALSTLYGTQLHYWLVALLIAAMCALIGAVTDAHAPVWRVVLFIITFSAFLQLVFYFVSVDGLAGQLRKSRPAPFPRAVWIGISVVLFFSFSLTALNHWDDAPWPQFDAWASTLQTMFSPVQIYDRIKSLSLGSYEAAAGLIGVLVSATAVRNLLQFRNFRRKDEDKLSIAQSLQVIGKFSESLTWIRQIRQKNAISLHNEAFSLAGLNQVAAALPILAHAKTLGGEPNDNRAVLVTLLQAGCLLPIPRQTLENIVIDLVRQDIHDYELCAILQQLVAAKKVDAEICSDICLTQANISEEGEPYLLTRLILNSIDANDNKSVVVSMVSRCSPVNRNDRAAYSAFALLAHIGLDDTTDPGEDAITLVEWLDRDMRSIFQYACAVDDDQVKLTIAGSLQAVIPIASALASDRTEEIEYLAGQILATVKKRQELEPVIAMIQQSQEALRRDLLRGMPADFPNAVQARKDEIQRQMRLVRMPSMTNALVQSSPADKPLAAEIAGGVGVAAAPHDVKAPSLDGSRSAPSPTDAQADGTGRPASSPRITHEIPEGPD